MKRIDDYIIPYYGLSEGIHEYDFVAENWFFEHFNNPDIKGGNVRVEIKLDKKPGFMEMDFFIAGFLEVICDRCLEKFNFNIKTEPKLFFRFGEVAEEQDDNVVVLSPDQTRINISQYIYEFSALSLPVQKFHENDKDGKPGCNAEMLKKLEEYQFKEEDKTDPRWDALLKLKNNK